MKIIKDYLHNAKTCLKDKENFFKYCIIKIGVIMLPQDVGVVCFLLVPLVSAG